MAKVKFVSGATELQFEVNISYPARRPIEKVQVVDRTASGKLRVESYGVTINTFPLIFVDISETDYDGLRSFFDTTANGALNSFTYYDESGATHTVRFTDNILDFSQTSINRYSGELTLEAV
jgi:hypothetical protein